ncbi:short-chain dehydrogenase [Citricoccus zhacaiensis]|uniref:Short-chain dehydrogenase n=1 Tax=Citricoccus zhacaiensis TaxID=489142 RepID=A0ABQ2LVK7_9MICC|nr:SDR family oxidoreductase [Citricoccus zhacaiensis]GGO43719.1 short-chain dehydrogenase [Citricoccus zhacaiensis]
MSTPTVKSYEDSAVVIAGGSSGVGLASAQKFLEAGVTRVALVSRNPERGQAARDRVAALNPQANVVFLPADLDHPQQVQEAVTAAHDRLGAIDVLVSSVAASYRPELLHTIDPEDFVSIINRQALPPMYLTRAVLPLMQAQGGGSIINIASDAAKVPTPGETVLGAAMAAITMFTRTAAMEAKRNGIRVNALTPSLIAGTPTADRVLTDGFSKTLFEKASRMAHLGVAEPDDLAEMVLFLGGPGAARLTGQVISVNGGISAG